MATAAGKLTKRQIDKWVVDGERFEARSDGANLWLRYRQQDLHPRWFFRYTRAGKQNVLSLGSYRDVSLGAARIEATKLRGQLAQGQDVAQGRRLRTAEAAAKTKLGVRNLGWLADEYYERYVAGRVKHPSIVKALIDNRIKPAIGLLGFEDVRPAHIDNLIRSTAKVAPSVSTKLLSRLKLIFNLGIKLGYLQSNPASAFDANDAGGPSASRDRWLTRDELSALFRAMGQAKGWSKQNTLTVKLLLMLAVRKSELTQAPIAEFDLSGRVWHLPATRTKSSTAISIPLPRQAVEAIQQLIDMGLGSEWLLPARKMQSRMTPYIGPDTLNAAMAKSIRPLMQSSAPFVIHDLRRTARTHLEALGVSPLVAERCLNHKLPGLMGVYNRHDYFEERREALSKLADMLDDINAEIA